MRTDELDFHLPPELIAQEPPAERHGSRLLHYRRADRSVSHRAFAELPSLLRAGDLLVFNDTRVLPARFVLRKPTGGQVEGLFLRQNAAGDWNVLLRNVGPFRAGAELRFDADETISVRLVERVDGGEFRVAVDPPLPAAEVLERVGRMPLPPYIKRDKARDAGTRRTANGTRPCSPARPARWPPRRPPCTSRPRCWPDWTPRASGGRSSR
jgi:S-adenosylmethionine:tRNA ribosyltransferase-isomerase